MTSFLTIDIGTTNIKAGIVDEEGNILDKEARKIEFERPERGAVTHDPEELYNNFLELSRQITQEYRSDVSYIVFSGYQFGFLPMDKNNDPLTNMVTLLDTRSKPLMSKIKNEFPLEEIYSKTGCPPLFTYILSRIMWLKQEKPRIFDKSSWFADIKSFFIEKLCGKPYTEPSIASVTQLYNIKKRDWDEELLSLIGIDRSQLPRVVPGEKIVDTLPSDTTGKLGLEGEISILPGVYDGGAMILGMGGHDRHLGICNWGTTAMFRSSSPKPLIDDPQKRRMQTYALTSDRYAIGGAINNAGISLRWFKENLSGDLDYPEIVERAAAVEPGAEGLFCFPFLTGERDPRIGNRASGSFFGMKEYHDYGHISRALLEGVGYSLNLIREALEENGVKLDEIVIGGSGSKDDLVCQILADIFDTPIKRSVASDSSLVGGAILAATEGGVYDSITEASEAMVETGKEFLPDDEAVTIYEKGYSFFKKMLQNYQKAYRLHFKEYL